MNDIVNEMLRNIELWRFLCCYQLSTEYFLANIRQSLVLNDGSFQNASSLRASASDSNLLCGRNAPLARSLSSDDLLISRTSSFLDPPQTTGTEETTKHKSLSIYNFSNKKTVSQKSIGSPSPSSRAGSDQRIDCAGSLDEKEFKEQTSSSRSYFGDLFSRKPSISSTKDHQALAKEKFRRRTVSSSNLFPPRSGKSGRAELHRSNSQDQSKQSFFQIFSKKQEPIDED